MLADDLLLTDDTLEKKAYFLPPTQPQQPFRPGYLFSEAGLAGAFLLTYRYAKSALALFARPAGRTGTQRYEKARERFFSRAPGRRARAGGNK